MKSQQLYSSTKKLFFLSFFLFAIVLMNSCQKDSEITNMEPQAKDMNELGVYSNAKKIGDLDENQLKAATCYPGISISSPVNNKVYAFDNVPVSFSSIGYSVTITNLQSEAFVSVYLDNTRINYFSNLPSGNWTFWNNSSTTNVSLGEGYHTLKVKVLNNFNYPNSPGCEAEKSVRFKVEKTNFSVSVSGPSVIYYPNKGEPLVTGTWTANVSPSGTYTYQWYRKVNSGTEYAITNATSRSYSKTFSFCGYNQSSIATYRVEVTRNGVTKSASKTVNERSKDGVIFDPR